jgi:ketosteroid isomerase-like protein
MSTEENKELVRRFYEEIDKGNLDAMDEFVAEDYIDHSPPPFPGFAHGRECWPPLKVQTAASLTVKTSGA